ncbi:MAG: hypothetical protein RJA81_1061 [Planctomycetota bacterium]|jgi:glycosyltransferase involved in cell wall biosynthesis
MADSNDILTNIKADERPFLTVFTPTYNRAHTLPELYESLKNQTCKDFQWLIIDDGSIDQTTELVKNWIKEDQINIRYIYQENGGKHIAYNHALTVADSELFWPLDSDDLALPKCIQQLKYHWQKIQEEKTQVNAISFLVQKSDGGKWNQDFLQDYFDERFPELIYKGIIQYDIWFVFELHVLRQFSYPVKWLRIYVPDALMPYAISDLRPIRFINERLGVYRLNANDLDRLSNFSRPEKLKSGGAASLFLQYWIVLNYGKRYFLRYPLKHLRFAIQFHRFGIVAGLKLRERLAWLEPRSVRYFSLLGLIPGMIAASITELRFRRQIRTGNK